MKVKKWLLGLVTFAAMVVLCAVCAGADTYGDFNYSVLDDGTVEITKYIGSAEKVDIPEKINGKSVTSIGGAAFYDCTSITSVIIPDSVGSMGVSAFGCCTNLESITLPDNVTNICDWAFHRCSNLTSITIPDGIMHISNGSFSECSSLTKVIIPNSVTQIGEAAFQDCTSLTGISIPNVVTSIGSYAFNGCSQLVSITIPDSITSIGDRAFCECTSLKGITIPDSVTCINDNTFFNCSSLTEITLPDGITQIGDFAFYNCNSLSKVKLPNGLTSIGEWAFGYCEKLNNINLPNSITYVGGYAFNHTAIINEQTDDVKYIDKWLMNYSTDTYTSDEIVIFVKEGTKNIAASAFNFSGIDEVVIPESVEIINSFAFYNCFSLEKIIIPRNVTNIGENAFGYYNDGGNMKNSNFIIYCYSGTAGEQYAIDNDFYYELLDNHEHSFGNWKITKAATCTATGTKTRTCSVCGKVETATIAKVAHKYVNTVVKPTYTAQGYTLHKCSVCGTSYKDTYTAKLTLAKVIGVKLGGRAADALRVNWTKNANASGYIVEMYQGNKWVRVAKITSNATTTYRASGLKASTVYKFRVRAYKMEGKAVAYGAYSTELAARTNPSVMTGVKLSGRAADALRINWSKNASADGYIVEMHQGNKWVRVAKITSNSTTTFRKAGLKASTVYKFRVRAYKMSGKTALYGNYSATVTARTNPSVVKGVKIGGKAKDALRVNWTKNASAQGYIVEMYKGGKWVRVAKITNSNTTTFRKSGLAKNTAYKFRVRAYHMSGMTALYGNYGSVSGKTAAK